MGPEPRRRLLALALAAALVSVLGAALATAAAIPDADYKGKVRGDGDKIEFNTSTNGRLIGSLSVQFDSKCRQGGHDYVNKNTSIVLYQIKVRRSGKFKGKDKRNYPGGGDVSVAKGRFSADGTSAKGRFSFHGTLSGAAIDRVECSASGRFKARTKAKPPGSGGGDTGPQRGGWAGTTAEGFGLQFTVERGEVTDLLFAATLECVRDPGAPGASNFTESYTGSVPRAQLNGFDFQGSSGPDHVSGSFTGDTAAGSVSVSGYRDDLELATCSTPGEIGFTATPD